VIGAEAGVCLQASFSRHRILKAKILLLFAIVRVDGKICVKDFMWFSHLISEIGNFEFIPKFGFFHFLNF
jgi:hypothetical protein